MIGWNGIVVGLKFDTWNRLDFYKEFDSYDDVISCIKKNRSFIPNKTLSYDDDSLNSAAESIVEYIRSNKKIALYSDYDVDGVMSCVSWIWFFKAISFTNYTYYIPSRFSEGYGVNKQAIKDLADKDVDLIISMDTGITAKEEVSYCKSLGIDFICTDHHSIQTELLPDCIVVNPKLYHDPYYKELCGSGISFVLIRKIANILEKKYELSVSREEWKDILALVGIATVCDIVDLNGANHSIVRLGLSALETSRRDILVKLKEFCAISDDKIDEKDLGFKIGPRINAVGRLEHVSSIIEAFISEDYDTIKDTLEYMSKCNNKRKLIQDRIFENVNRYLAHKDKDEDVLFIGDSGWHHGVLGIVASKLVNLYYKPSFIFSKDDDGMCTGSVRSIPGVDVTEMFLYVKEYLIKYGGHASAGGFSFRQDNEDKIREKLKEYCSNSRKKHPDVWKKTINVDCKLHFGILNTSLVKKIQDLKPFGHGFEEPIFEIEGSVSRVYYSNDKKTGEKKHTIIYLQNNYGITVKVLFFNEVLLDIKLYSHLKVLVNIGIDSFQGVSSIALYGIDIAS